MKEQEGVPCASGWAGEGEGEGEGAIVDGSGVVEGRGGGGIREVGELFVLNSRLRCG